MKRTRILAPLVTLFGLLAAGCASHEGAYEPKNANKFDLENRAKFVLLDKATQDAVTCSGLQERVLEDGRLEVVANIRNRLNRRIEVQAGCVFKNEAGFPINEDPQFQTLILTENSQEGVRFVSLNAQAKTYTVRVRQAR
jgi:hypothetical protein